MDSNEKKALSDGVFHRSHGSFELVLSPVLLGLLGLWLDSLLGLRPLLTLVFVLAGAVGAFAKLYYGFKADTAALARLRAEAAARREAAERPAADERPVSDLAALVESYPVAG